MYFKKIWVSTFGTIFETIPDLNHRAVPKNEEVRIRSQEMSDLRENKLDQMSINVFNQCQSFL